MNNEQELQLTWIGKNNQLLLVLMFVVRLNKGKQWQNRWNHSAGSICIQDPEWSESRYLIEEVIAASKNALSGVGAFAFASAGGINLLFQDHDFVKFLARAPFDLVIGIDAITDLKALDRLLELTDIHQNLKPRAFLGSVSGTIFHPKMCWFRHSSRGICLVGSGNLTPGGLRGNYEAFSVASISRADLLLSDELWKAWTRFHSAKLLPLDHPDVRRKAKENEKKRSRLTSRQREVLIEADDGTVSVGRPKGKSTEVPIAEIPRSGSRWNQANFDMGTFRSFFGATPGRTQRVMLTHIDSDGTPGAQEVRPSVSVKSHNYRFELEAGANLAYPSKGRPIGIFVKVATRTFRYRLLMPGSHNHKAASDFLDQRGSQKTGQVRRLLTNINVVRRFPFFRKLAD